jgi:hypothetical protein
VLPQANKVGTCKSIQIDNKLIDIKVKMKKVVIVIYLMIATGVVGLIALLLKFNVL